MASSSKPYQRKGDPHPVKQVQVGEKEVITYNPDGTLSETREPVMAEVPVHRPIRKISTGPSRRRTN